MDERRRMDRRNFSHYMQVTNERTGKPLGHLVDISSGGFKLDAEVPVRENVHFTLRLELSRDVSTKSFMTFRAYSRWCQQDDHQPGVYKVGFELTTITPGDFEIFLQMFDKYGTAG